MLLAVIFVFQLTGGCEEVKFPVSDDSARSGSVKKAPSLKALIVTGQSNKAHDWTKLSPVLKTILEQRGLFAVDVSTSPAKGQDMSSYKPDFAAYDVVVLDYDGDEWPDQTKDNFVKYVKDGGGVVVIHASNNSFPKWKEYNEITGLGGWGGRDEKSGPMVRYRDGKMVLDNSPGRGGSHGPPTPYQVINRVDHPITNGLPQKWMHAKDELYSNLRGPAKNLTVLSTAYADPANKGTGEHEPVLFTVSYGKGRIFHDIMGHVRGDFISSVECVGFIVTLQRGAEWAATGRVTQEVPVDFPTADKVMSRKGLKVQNIERMLADIADYKYGGSRGAMVEIDGFISLYLQKPGKPADIEKKFIEYLNSDATLESKQFICEKLGLIGTKASVETLGEMLIKQETSDMARGALERIPDSSVDKLLRETVGKTSGKMQVGIIDTIGRRKDTKAVKMLGKLTVSGDKQSALAAVAALGNIANQQARTILKKKLSNTTGQMQVVAYDSYLKCVEKVAEGNSSKAFKMYKDIYGSSASSIVRGAALRGMVVTADKDADEIIIKAMKDSDPEIRSMAILLVGQLQREDQLIAIANELANLQPAAQIQFVTALAEAGQTAAAPQVMSLIDAEDRQVSLAAIEAIGKVGDESAVKVLVDIAASDDKEKRRAARKSLYMLRGQKVDGVIVDGIANAKNKTKIELIKAVGQRNIIEGAEILFEIYKDQGAKVQTESIKVLKVIAGPDKIRELINVLILAKDATAQKEAQKTLAAVALKNPEPQGRARLVLSALRIVRAPEPRSLLVGVLGRIGDDDSLEVLYESLGSSNEKIKYAAVTSLSDWPNSKPAAKLLEAAAKSTDEKTRVLAIRGFVKAIGRNEDGYVDDVVGLFKQAVELADGAAEKKMIISGLSTIESTFALDMAASYLDDDQLKQEAQLASVKIASAVAANNPQLTKEVMNKVIAGTNNSDLKEEAVKILEAIAGFSDYIVTWEISGPYAIKDTGGQKLFDMELAPEKDGSSVEWRGLVNKADAKKPYIIDLGKVVGGNNKVVYAKTNVYSPMAQKAVLELGSDDGVKVWVNGELVHANNAIRPVKPGSDKAQVDLKEGSNALLVKSVQVAGNWGFCVRLRTANGRAIEGLKVVAETE